MIIKEYENTVFIFYVTGIIQNFIFQENVLFFLFFGTCFFAENSLEVLS